ncbi:MAG: 2-oxoacid:acceptor oxidoreductase family protein [Candidatus Zixiibacteriota bacterium]|nr:MAG: 2-oxoacid:acceptor oxidoreductase family protein [candidate division Zixibacteria bacterium]
MALKYSIRFSGAGGQGLIQAARILAEAAAIFDNKNAAESCSYGPEARGNASRADIIISDDAIDYPKIDSIDLLMVLTQEAYDRSVKDLSAGGVVVADRVVKAGEELSGRKIYQVAFTEIAEKRFQNPGMVNIIALGFFAAINGAIGSKSIRNAMLARVPKMSEPTYMRAFDMGLEAAREYKSK